jgi:hypothetical protein
MMRWTFAWPPAAIISICLPAVFTFIRRAYMQGFGSLFTLERPSIGSQIRSSVRHSTVSAIPLEMRNSRSINVDTSWDVSVNRPGEETLPMGTHSYTHSKVSSQKDPSVDTYEESYYMEEDPYDYNRV